jgi:hypothetical protein
VTTPRDRITGERLDRLMTVEIRRLEGGLPPGFVVPMYDICRAHHGEPLSSLAAARLGEALAGGGAAVIATGCGVPPHMPLGETDGPVGAAALARALMLGFGARVVLATEERHAGAVRAAAQVVEGGLPDHPPIVTACFPPGLEPGRAAAAALMREHQPRAVVFIERDGPDPEGFCHGVRGDCRRMEEVGHVYLLAGLARERGVLTIGVGDGGNEVGFGAVREALAAVHPTKGPCLAGHASGVVTAIATDVVVAASVSNWGAHAIAAALAVQRGRADLLHTPETERRLIEACVAAGAVDGATFRAEALVDGIDLEGHLAMVGLLRSIVAVNFPAEPR